MASLPRSLGLYNKDDTKTLVGKQVGRDYIARSRRHRPGRRHQAKSHAEKPVKIHPAA